MIGRTDSTIYRFEDFRFDTKGCQLYQLDENGEYKDLRVAPKVGDLLSFFLKRSGEILLKDEILQEVWNDSNGCVEESNISENVKKLRQALCDTEKPHRFIETVPRRGYRFIATVEKENPTKISDEITQITEEKVVEIGNKIIEIQNQLSKDSFNRFGKTSAVSEYEFKKCKKLKWLKKEVLMSENYQLLPMLRTVRTEDLPKEHKKKEDFSSFDYREYEVRKWQEKLNDKYKTYQTLHSIDAIFSDFEQVIRDCADEKSREKIIVGKTPRLVVLGEPGSGKSTLCKFLAFSCQYQQFERLPSQSGVNWRLVSSEGNFLAPVRIKLSDWENWAIEKKDFSLENYLINSLYECVKDIPIKEQWWSLFEKGEILLLLDGLDEIGNNATFKEKVTDTLQRTNRCPTIVTCRTVSFETHQDILSEFPIFSLDGLSKFQQDALIHEYEKDGSLVADELRKQLDSSYEIASLASNPLLLTIICFVVSNSDTNQEIRLPEKKSQLYDKAIDRLLNAWQDRENPTNELEIEEKKEILAELAYCLWTENEDRQMGFSGKKIKDIIAGILKMKDFQNSRDLAYSLLKDFSKQGGILIGESNNNYGFLHLTFYEYLVAFALANRKNCVEIAFSKAFKSEWEKILVFFGGTLSKRNKIESTDFFLKLVNLFWDSIGKTEKEDDLDFFSPGDDLLRLLYVTIGFGIESEISEVKRVAMDVWHLLGDMFLIDEYLFELFEFHERKNSNESTRLFSDYYEKEIKLLRISQSFLIPIIMQIVEDSQERNETRRHAVLMLSVMPPENATPVLEKLIQNNNLYYELREDALWVLTNVFFADAIKVLKRINNNSKISKWVRDESVEFLLKLSKENKPLFLHADEKS